MLFLFYFLLFLRPIMTHYGISTLRKVTVFQMLLTSLEILNLVISFPNKINMIFFLQQYCWS